MPLQVNNFAFFYLLSQYLQKKQNKYRPKQYIKQLLLPEIIVHNAISFNGFHLPSNTFNYNKIVLYPVQTFLPA